jgi:hypothetical protein
MPDTFRLTHITHREIDGDIVFVGYPQALEPPRQTQRKRGS